MAIIGAETDTASPPLVTIAGALATIRLNRPARHNRLEPADLTALQQAFDRIGGDPAIRVLVLTGTGKSFSSGYHLGALLDHRSGEAQSESRDENAFERTVDRLEALRVPTIAALNGSVYGGSTDLALACDFRIGVEGIEMRMPAARLGIVYYPSGIERYVSRLGIAAAKRLFLTGEAIDAAEMLRIGYLDAVVPPHELRQRVDALAAVLAGGAPLALAGLKHAINQAANNRLDRHALAAVRKRCTESEDHAEALQAWAQKRQPAFRGR